ncbi:MAG: Fe-Mn family superoxide dismutase [Parcubacteria group bacterium]
MAKEIIAKSLEITADLDGISLKALTEHYKLYEGYVKKVSEIRERLKTADRTTANATYSEIGELGRQETFALNGVKLHEIYFGILGGDGKIKGKIADMITRDYGSVENWTAIMSAAGLSARGWVITAYDINEERLRIFNADAHNVGIVAGIIPLITLDVYEHAYFMDYGTNRKGYIEAFFKNLSWDAIDSLAKNI